MRYNVQDLVLRALARTDDGLTTHDLARRIGRSEFSVYSALCVLIEDELIVRSGVDDTRSAHGRRGRRPTVWCLESQLEAARERCALSPRQAILGLLADGPMTTRQISLRMHRCQSGIRVILHDMVRRGAIVRRPTYPAEWVAI